MKQVVKEKFNPYEGLSVKDKKALKSMREKKYLVQGTVYGSKPILQRMLQKLYIHVDDNILEHEINKDPKTDTHVWNFLAMLKGCYIEVLAEMCDGSKDFDMSVSCCEVQDSSGDVDAFGILDVNGTRTYHRVEGATSPRVRLDLESFISYLEDINEKLTHMSEKTYAAVNKQAAKNVKKLSKREEGFSLLDCAIAINRGFDEAIEELEKPKTKGKKK